VQAAIDAAGAAGGGVVTLGVGRWYLDGPLLLPDNVRLKGAGMDRTAIYFGFRNASNTPSTMIGAVHGKESTCTYGYLSVSFSQPFHSAQQLF
jgi:polygalacturonase